MTDLHWYCAECGDTDPAEPPYEHGDCEPCECGGVARVVTLKQAAKVAQAFCLGNDAHGMLLRLAKGGPRA